MGKPWDSKKAGQVYEYYVPFYKGYNKTLELLREDREVIWDTEEWGPLLHAMYSGKVEALTYLMEEFSFNFRKGFFLDPDMDSGSNSLGKFNKILPFYLIIHN
jgi:hypothetical protein